MSLKFLILCDLSVGPAGRSWQKRSQSTASELPVTNWVHCHSGVSTLVFKTIRKNLWTHFLRRSDVNICKKKGANEIERWENDGKLRRAEKEFSGHILKFPISWPLHGTEDCAPDSAPMWGSKAGKLLLTNIAKTCVDLNHLESKRTLNKMN